MVDIRGETAQSGPAQVAFVAGMLTSMLMFLMVFAFLAYRIGFSTVVRRAGINFTGLILDIPDRLIEELRAADAVIDNAGNPTGAREHDTFVVRPDRQLGYVLRPGTEGLAYVIRPRGPVNLDPPVVYIRTGTEVSAELQRYLEERTQLKYSFSIDAKGFRRTVPPLESERRILMVGDSALFGTGVGDEHTIASHLQGLVGGSYQVVNAGVGGYSGFQAFEMARKLAGEDRYDILIYAAHHNDFFESRHIASPELAGEILARFASLKDEFPGGIIVSLVSYLYYVARDTLLEQGWKQDKIEATDALRAELPRIAAAAGFEFIDFTDTVEDSIERNGTIFSPFALYCDRAHLSPRGNRLLAEQMLEAIHRMTD